MKTNQFIWLIVVFLVMDLSFFSAGRKHKKPEWYHNLPGGGFVLLIESTNWPDR